MNKLKVAVMAVLILSFIIVAVVEAQARPRYMRRYNVDPKAKAQYKNKCTICHIGKGGEENTTFGFDFADVGHQFTPDLQARYRRYFKK